MRLVFGFLILFFLAGCGNAGFNAVQTLRDVLDVEASAANSTMSVTSRTPADGMSRSAVQIILRNKSAMPIEGASMSLSVSGSGNVVTACSLSDKNGLSLCYITSTSPGIKTVIATAKFQLTETTVFYAPPSSNLIGGVVSGGNYQRASSGQKLMATVGLPQSPNRNYDSRGTLRLKTGFQGQIWTN